MNTKVMRKVKYQELDAVLGQETTGGWELVSVFPEIVNTYNVGSDSEYTLPTTIACVFKKR